MKEFFWKQILGRCPRCKSKLEEYGYSEPMIKKVLCVKCSWGQKNIDNNIWEKFER